MKKLAKKIAFILIILMIIMSTMIEAYVIAVESGLESITGNGQVRYGSYTLDGRPVYVYGTTGGGYVDYLEGDKSYHIYQAEARSGWQFVRWVTYYEISSNSRGQNTTIGLSDTYYFSTPEDDEEECNVYSSKIRVNNGNDISDYSDLYKLYAVFKPIITGTVDEHGELSTSYTYNGQATNRIELPVSYGTDSETIRIESKNDGYIIDTIITSDGNVNNVNADLYFYQFKEVKGPKSVHATFKPITYEIAFDGNGSTSGEMNNQTFLYNTAQNLNTNVFKRKGYTFNGWNTNVDGNGTNYTDKQQINNLTTENEKTITLYAQWIPADLTGTITITGEEKLGKTLTVTVEETNNTGTLSYQWQRDEEDIQGATEITYTITEEDVDKNISCIITSSVQTNSISNTTDVISDEYEVVYDLTNITTEGELIAKIGEDYIATLLPEEKYKLPKSIVIKIDDINLSSDEFEYDYETGKLTIPANKIDGNIEIEIIAEKIYKISLDANGGKFLGKKNILMFDDYENCDYDNLEVPTRHGYKFIGYYTEKTGGTSIEMIMASEAGIENDMTFYAQWEEVKNNVYNGNNPQTSDNILLFVKMLVIAVIGIFVTTKFRKKNKNK